VRVTLIINPFSGKRDNAAKLAQIHTAFAAERTPYQVSYVSEHTPLDAITSRILADRPDRVLVCGGDGTATQVGNALLHSDIPIGVLPGGTANAIARAIGVPSRLYDATRFALTEDALPFDAIHINGRTSLLISGAGYDSDVIASADAEMKRRVGVLAYVWTGMLRLGDLTETRFHVTVDGEFRRTVTGNCLLIANIGKLFGEFDLFRETRPDDGCVHAAVLSLGDLQEFISLSGRALAGIDSPIHQSAFFDGRKIEIRFDKPLRTQIDGDVGGETDQMTAEVLPGALRIVRSPEGKRPMFQMPGWVAAMAEDLMGRWDEAEQQFWDALPAGTSLERFKRRRGSGEEESGAGEDPASSETDDDAVDR